METKTIKISADTYREVCAFAGELQRELGEPVSLDKALGFLIPKKKISDLAGSWEMSEKEASEMLANLGKGWKKWKIKSV